MRGMSKTIPLMLGLAAACGSPRTYASIAVEDGVAPRVMVTRVPTAEQLAMVAALAEQVVEAEQLSYRLQDSPELTEWLHRQGRLENLVQELERRQRDLEQSRALRSEISRISLRADVTVPLEELRLTLDGTRRQGSGLFSPHGPSPY